MLRHFTSFNCRKVILVFTLVLCHVLTSRAQNPIVTENALPGNPKSEWDISGAGDLSIQGFATDISVNKGGTIRFKIDVNGGGSYTIKIYRLGYYQGNGARLIEDLGTFQGVSQPDPSTNTTTGLVDCANWSESASWNVPSTAVSGIYIAKLTRSSGSSHITFIVRDDAANAPLLFKTSDATWQAYNNYGGNSLYNGATSYPSGHATKVSYNRPFLTRNGGGGGGAMEDWLFNAEYPMIRFLERNGYYLSYTTDVDMDRDQTPITPSKHKVILSVGHDEYWSLGERTRVENARDAGVHLAFFSGNEVYWKTRWENNNRTLVCYKEGILGENVCGNKCDPTSAWTGLWREGGAYDAGRPENALTGQISWELVTAALRVPSEYKNLRFWRNTSVASQPDGGAVTFANGTIGYEADFEQYPESYPSGRITLSNTVFNGKTHKLSLYRHPSGALVFGAGTIQWSWGLDNVHDRGSAAPSTAMQQATVNLLADMGVQPGSLMSGLVAASASTDVTAPVVNITSPANGANLPQNSAVTITGTASDANGVLVGVEISVDGGLTWKAVNGTTNWSYSWTPSLPGAATIRVRGFDDSGNMGVPGASGSPSNINVNVGGTGPVCPCTIFSPSSTPAVQLDFDNQPIEVGVKFRSSQNGFITGLRFYKGSGNTGTHIGHLWSSNGTMLAEATFINETASGWQEVALANPVAITAGNTYVASYFSSVGYYSSTNPYFSSEVVNGYLRALANGEDGSNGVYVYTGAPAFPNNGFQSSNYWVDVVFDPSASQDVTPPVVTITSPAAGNVSGNINISASATDNIIVSGVQFQLNGTNFGTEILSSPFSIPWNTLSYTNGPYSISAIARDGAGNRDTSTVVIVTVNNTISDTIAPTVAITGPAAGNVSGTVTITGNATDNIGVAGVQFLLDGVNLGAEDITSPYSGTWNSSTAASGTHVLTARARDTSGNVTTSLPVLVNVSNNSLVLAMGFNENAGTVANDFSGNNNHGTLVNGPVWNASGKFGSAISFDGSNDLVNIADAASLDLTNGMTLEAWVNPTVLTGFRNVISKERTTNAFAYVLSANNNASNVNNQRPNSRIRTGSTNRTVNGNVKLPLNTWTHIASTYDGANFRFFINGVQVSSIAATGNIPITTNMLRIGGSPNLGAQYFAGLIDEVRIYNRALSQSEIQLDMNIAVGSDGVPPTVTMLSPSPGNVTNTVNISAIANDNVGVSGVQFLLNGQNFGSEDLVAPYEISWNTTLVANGSYTLAARARDASGNATTSAGVVVVVANMVPDTIAPTVSLTAPAAGNVSGSINVSATASDNIGVAGVQFLLNGAFLGSEDIIAPYAVSWNTGTSPNGTYILKARARDAAGNLTTSDSIVVTVSNTSNLIVALPFSEDSGVTALDISGNSHNGTLTNSPTRAQGKYGQGINLDGTNDFISLPDHPNFTLDPTQSYTWSGWIRSNNFNQWSTVLSHTIDANNFFYLYAHSTPDLDGGPVTNGLSVYWWTNGGNNKLAAHSTSNVLTTGQWYFVAVTYDASQPQNNRFSIFVNGVDVTDRSDVASSGTLGTIDPAFIRLGANQPYGEYINGSMDEYRFYRRLLSGTEIQVDMNTPLIAGPDLSPPIVSSTTPSMGAIAIPVNSTISVLFNEPIDPSSVSTTNISVRDAQNITVGGTITYNAGTLTATFTPSAPLNESTEYFAQVKGGATGIRDMAGNQLASDYLWNFTSATPPPPPPNEGPGGPILVVSAATNPFSRYTVEILRAEGLNEFLAVDISQVNASMLAGYDVVVLGEMPLSASNVTLFTNYVNAGGKLIAFRPDAQLNSLMGLTSTGNTLSDQYLQVNTASGPGAGIVNQTMQFHGTANRYTLNGSTSIATLYSNANTATSNPAVSMRNVGSNGGVAVAFAYDLPRSIIYTRQGNPNLAGEETDGTAPIRPNDLFYPDYVDLNKVAIPQADEQQRLLANIIIQSNLSKKPLPRFWYLPKGYKAAVIFALDDHGTNSGTVDIFNKMIANSTPGCSVDGWECARATSWYYLGIPFTNTQAVNYLNQGFEMGRHVENGCTNFTSTSLNLNYTTQLEEFRSQYPGLPAQNTHRFHCIVWSDWVTQAKVGRNHGIRFSLDYYYWPATWVNGRPGLFTGSGMPMRFADVDGSLIDVYQGVSQLVNENGVNYTLGVNTLLDNALGPQGFYGTFGAHDDYRDVTFSNEVIASAKARNVPIVTAQQVLTWIDGRNNSSFSNISWNGGNLSFTVSAAAGANFMKGMLPASTGTNNLISITRNGSPWPFTLEIIKGMSYAFFDATTGSYVANYSIDITPPSVISTQPLAGTTEVGTGATISAVFNEAMDPASLGASSFELRNQANQLVSAVVNYNASTQTISLQPNVQLATGTVYTARIAGGASGAKDISGNALAGDFTWSFTTTVGDTIRPLITATDPAAGATAITVSSGISVTFNESMTAASISGSTFELSAGGFATPASVSYDPGTRVAQLTPLAALATNTTYTVIVRGQTNGVKDSAGNALASDSTWTFTTDAGDITPPVIVNFSPANGSENVSRSVVVTAMFDEPLNAATINGVTVELRDPSTNLVPAGVTYDAGTRTISLAPLSPLATLTGYTAKLTGGTGGIKDLSGNALQADFSWTFTTLVGDTVAPLITLVSPSQGSFDVATNSVVSATFNETMNAGSISGATFELRNSSNTLIPATVNYNALSRTVTLVPSTNLANSTTYTARIRGADGGVSDSTGNFLAKDSSWSFTTVAASANTITIFPPSATPNLTTPNDGVALEVGMKFRSTVSGQVLGVRYYKGASFTTGTRIGHIWSSTGTLLGAATFIDETASGWQEVMFSTPVTIAANTTYVVAYHSSGGHYTVTNPYFVSNAPSTGPLSGLQYGVDGPNGMYRYTPTPAFPNTSYQSSNYWVDVVFLPDAPLARMSQQPSIIPRQQPHAENMGKEKRPPELEVSVSPNPSNDFFNLVIASPSNDAVSVRILDALGQLVERKEQVTPNTSTRMGQQLKSGAYIIEVMQGQERRVIKVMKID